MACSNGVHQIALGTHLYESRIRSLPPGAKLHLSPGQGGVSWRALILDELEEGDLADSIGVQPDGGYNSNYPAYIPGIFICPSAPDRPLANGPIDLDEPPEPGNHLHSGWSGYSGVNGSGATTEGVMRLSAPLNGEVYVDGVYYPDSHTRFSQVTDGTSSTLAIGERAYLEQEDTFVLGAVWEGDPRRSRPDNMVTLATKNVRYPINAAPASFGYSDRDPARPTDKQATLKRNDLYFGSDHPGGAHFALVDGSVQFLTDSIDINLLRDLATRDGEEVTNESL